MNTEQEWDNLAFEIHETNVKHGFWESNNTAEKLMLIVTELAEACEADREKRYFKGKIHGIMNFNDEAFLSAFVLNVKDTFEDELADAVIRIIDLSIGKNFDLMAHIQAKARFNKSRPYKHNKEY
jgi:NTP pyrophosphatase (non-canonical NTP hydrolase)